MKKRFLFLLSFGLLFCGCKPEQNSLIGNWTVDKVNVQFDESRTTPELVKQVGEMERGNCLRITSDSCLVFKGTEEQWEENISMRNDSTLYCRGTLFGTWKDGMIITTTTSPVGEVVVVYKKE
jgi:hypothetical protein